MHSGVCCEKVCGYHHPKGMAENKKQTCLLSEMTDLVTEISCMTKSKYHLSQQNLFVSCKLTANNRHLPVCTKIKLHHSYSSFMEDKPEKCKEFQEMFN